MNELTTSIWFIIINIILASGVSICLIGITATFRILNFLLLLLIGCYLFIKKIRPLIKQSIYTQACIKQDMKDQEIKLQTQEDHVILSYEQQKNHIALLTLKLSAWKNHFNRFKDIRHQQKEIMINTINNRIHIQSAKIADTNLNKIIASPDMLNAVEKKLIEQFSNDVQGKQFIDSIINNLNKRAQC